MQPPPLPSDAWYAAEPLAPHTTLRVGGPARYRARCKDLDALRRSLAWAQEASLPTFVLGGGSNLLVSDEGFPGVVIQFLDESLSFEDDGESCLVRAGAGLSWDRLVAEVAERGLAGVECLSGIPGWVGAAPIQNIGAYGQEVSEAIVTVDVLDRETGEALTIETEDCAFGYRTSAFKAIWKDRFIVTALTLRLARHGHGAVRYGDLERRFPKVATEPPSVTQVRQTVLEIRRSKSMVLDAQTLADDDPNRRSAGSFFMNPIVSATTADDVVHRVARLRGQEEAAAMPRYSAGENQLKLSAAWLIERAGFHRGYCLGPAGLSTRHVLALVNRGDGNAQDLVILARRVRHRVRDAFGVTLQPEPVFVGFEKTVDELLG